MKKVILFILLIVSSSDIVYSQSKSFFGDVETMKISLNFKDYVLANDSIDPAGLPCGTTSKKIFLRSDSSVMVRVHLSTISYGKKRAKPLENEVSWRKSKAKANDKRSKMDKVLKKFGADGGGLEMIKKQMPPSPILSGYTAVWGGIIFSKGGLMSLEVYQHEGSKRKMSERTLENLASDLIQFND